MKRAIGMMVIGGAVLGGCGGQAPPPTQKTSPVQNLNVVPPPASGGSTPAPTVAAPGVPSSDERVIARANGQPITMGQLMRPLVEAHGLQMLVGLVQLELARQDARAAHLTISPEDVRAERELTLEKMFKEADQKEQDQLDDAERKGLTERARQLRQQIRNDREQLLTQYLQEKNFSRTEFDLKLQINACLRKQADRMLQGKVTDEMVEKEFGVEYGETARVRYIQLDNQNEVAEARRRVAAGEDFGDVAQRMSRNARGAAMKGEMIPFSRQTPGLPESFKQLAFSLQPGQVSDTLSLGGHFYIIKLEQKFPPKAVKFESVKDALRRSMYDRLTQNLMQELDGNLGRRAVELMRIEDAGLKRQFEDYQAQQAAAIRDRQKMDEQWKKERLQSAATQPAATEPAAPASTAPSTQP